MPAKQLVVRVFVVFLVVVAMFVTGTSAQAETPAVATGTAEEALRAVLREYAPMALSEYTSVRQDELVSFQGNLLIASVVAPFTTPEAKRMAMGLMLTNGFYCLAFGKNAEAAKYYEAYHQLADELALRDLADIDMTPPASLKTFFADPSAADDAQLSQIVKDMDQKLITNLEILASQPAGVDLAVDLFYAVSIESFYLVAQMVVQCDGKSEGALLALANEAKNADVVVKALAAVESDPRYATICEVPEKKAVLDPVLALLKEKAGKLGKSDAETILKLIAAERAAMVAGTIAGKDLKE